jgi:hypothetical protein
MEIELDDSIDEARQNRKTRLFPLIVTLSIAPGEDDGSP